MVAYFYSKFTNKMKIAFAAGFLVFCLIGTHAIGFSHSISHAHLQSQAAVTSITAEGLPSLNHSADVCHLFDALTLAIFVGSNPVSLLSYNGIKQEFSSIDALSIAHASFEPYQSRAPPSLHI
jgi:hypothetical protein